MSDADSRKTALHDAHAAMEARMADEGGWLVPMSYRGPLEEAKAARRGAVVADVSHLSRVRLRGYGALDLLQRVCSHDVAHQEDDTTRLTCLCNARGGVIDLCACIRLTDTWLLIGDAGNRKKLLTHLRDHADDLDVKIDDRTEKTAQLAVVGPEAPGILDEVLPFRVSDLSRGTVKSGTLMVARYVAARTGPTDLWSLEVVIPKLIASQAWRFITHKLGDNAFRPLGMVGRDVLRVEAGLPRYGSEVNEAIDPFAAGLGRCVDFVGDFLGSEALAEIHSRGPSRVLTAFLLKTSGQPTSDSIPRRGWAVVDALGTEVGTVTSGTYSPKHDALMALAHVSRSASPDDLAIRTPSREVPAEAVDANRA